MMTKITMRIWNGTMRALTQEKKSGRGAQPRKSVTIVTTALSGTSAREALTPLEKVDLRDTERHLPDVTVRTGKG